MRHRANKFEENRRRKCVFISTLVTHYSLYPHVAASRRFFLELTVMAGNRKIKPLYTSHNQGGFKISGSSKQQQDKTTEKKFTVHIPSYNILLHSEGKHVKRVTFTHHKNKSPFAFSKISSCHRPLPRLYRVKQIMYEHIEQTDGRTDGTSAGRWTTQQVQQCQKCH